MFGSFYKQELTKFLNSWDQSSLFDNFGGGIFKISKRTFIAGKSEFGASPLVNSSAVIPKDQISALPSYSLLSRTSGAWYSNVPTSSITFCPLIY